MASIQLSNEVRAVYDVVDGDKVYPRSDFGKWGTVVFAELTLEDAERLERQGFPHLARKKVAKVATPTPTKED